MSKLDELRKQRIKLLQIHYDLADGLVQRSVMRPDVAKELGFEDFNDDKLYGQIQYLEQMSFLSVETNVTDTLTIRGVMEVENGFPTLDPKEPTQSKATTGYSPNDLEASILRLVHEQNEKNRNRNKYTKEELIRMATRSIDGLERVPAERAIDILIGQKYFSSKTERVNISSIKAIYGNKPSIPVRSMGTTYYSLSDKALLFIDGRLGTSTGPTQTISTKDTPYSNRRKLELLFESARSEIKIVDPYLGRKALDYLLAAPNVPIKIITSPKALETERGLLNAIEDFTGEYTGEFIVKIDASKAFHGRFIVIDDQTTLVDHSLKQFGEKPTALMKVSEDAPNREFIRLFDTVWDDPEVRSIWPAPRD